MRRILLGAFAGAIAVYMIFIFGPGMRSYSWGRPVQPVSFAVQPQPADTPRFPPDCTCFCGHDAPALAAQYNTTLGKKRHEEACRLCNSSAESLAPAPVAAPPPKPEKPKGPHYRLVIMIGSARANAAQRQMCRDTWLTLIKNDPTVMYRFVVGECADKHGCAETDKALDAEHQQYGDLLRTKPPDHYRNLIQKVYSLIMWVAHGGREHSATEHMQHWSQGIARPTVIDDKSDHDHDDDHAHEMDDGPPPFTFDYMFKTDDDSLVRVDELLKELSRHRPEEFVYLGNIYQQAHVFTDPNNKYYEPKFRDCGSIYPPFATGIGYALSAPVVNWIAHAPGPLRVLANEDTTVGLWLMPLDVKRVHRGDIFPGDSCVPNFMLVHYQKGKAMSDCYERNVKPKSVPTEQIGWFK